MARKGYPPEFRRRGLDLVAAGKSVVARQTEDTIGFWGEVKNSTVGAFQLVAVVDEHWKFHDGERNWWR